MLVHTDGCAKQYHFVSTLYLLSCLALAFLFIIHRDIGATVYVNYIVDVLNFRDKHMLNLEKENLLNTELICDYTKF